MYNTNNTGAPALQCTEEMLRNALYEAQLECQVCYAEAFYFRTLAMRVSKLVNSEKFHKTAIQSLLPVYRMLDSDDTMLQNLILRVKKDCRFRSWEWDEYLASVEQRRRSKKTPVSQPLQDLTCPSSQTTCTDQ